jgi:hypothetical protein
LGRLAVSTLEKFIPLDILILAASSAWAQGTTDADVAAQIRRLKDTNPDVRRAAAWALRIGPDVKKKWSPPSAPPPPRTRTQACAPPPPRHSERLGLPRKKGSPPSAPASPRQSVCVCLVAPSFRLCLRSSLCKEPGLHRDPRSPQNCRSTVEKCVPRKISSHRGCVAIIQILGGTLGSVRLSRRSSFNFVRGSCGQLKF